MSGRLNPVANRAAEGHARTWSSSRRMVGRKNALLSIEEQERRVVKLISSRGLHLVRSMDEARQTCARGRDFAGASKAYYVAHYETTGHLAITGRFGERSSFASL